MRGPGAPAARSHRGRPAAPPPYPAGRGGRCLVPCSPAWSPGAGLAAGWPRPPGAGAILARSRSGISDRGYAGSAFAGCPMLLAVDEHVVGLVGDVYDRRGLRVSVAGRGDAAERVEAEHLDG